MYPNRFSTVIEVDYDTPYDRHVIIEESHDTRFKKRGSKDEQSLGSRILRWRSIRIKTIAKSDNIIEILYNFQTTVVKDARYGYVDDNKRNEQIESRFRNWKPRLSSRRPEVSVEGGFQEALRASSVWEEWLHEQHSLQRGFASTQDIPAGHGAAGVQERSYSSCT